MIKLKRFLRPAGIVVGLLGVLLVLGFVERASDATLIGAVRVQVNGGAGLHFLDDASIRREVLDHGTAVMGMSIGDVDVPAIERRLRAIPAVSRAEVYHTMDGTLHVKVGQREPIVRVLNADGTSFYIDKDGWTMPLSDEYTARVLVVTGKLHEPGVRDGVIRVVGHGGTEAHGLSDDIHRLASFIRSDPFWNALIDQVVLNEEGGFELVPKVGAQRILIGDGSMLDQRFAKLKIFYDKGIPKADWRRYARIDLRFADQIVCTKRTLP